MLAKDTFFECEVATREGLVTVQNRRLCVLVPVLVPVFLVDKRPFSFWSGF